MCGQQTVSTESEQVCSLNACSWVSQADFVAKLHGL